MLSVRYVWLPTSGNEEQLNRRVAVKPSQRWALTDTFSLILQQFKRENSKNPKRSHFANQRREPLALHVFLFYSLGNVVLIPETTDDRCTISVREGTH